MFRTARPHTAIVPLIALAATLALTSSRAEAQVTPFKFKGGGQVPDGPSLLPSTTTAYTTTETATQLGKYTGEGQSQLAANREWRAGRNAGKHADRARLGLAVKRWSEGA